MAARTETKIKIWEEVRAHILRMLANENYFKHGRKGLCTYLSKSRTAGRVKYAVYTPHTQRWPEMYKYKPKTQYDSAFWWSTGLRGQQKRLAIVDLILTDLRNRLKKDS
jgi:hypothetical protein